jgi:release factor glutamine methyltransferase
MTLGEVLKAAIAEFDRKRVPASRLTAEVLLAHCLGVDRVHLVAHDNDSIRPDRAERYRDTVRRRLVGEPLQYITGIQEFYGRDFKVDSNVLIPRPETEFVVDTVKELNRSNQPRIIDVGTGSGCIAITLALEIENSRVTATDISSEALGKARQNALELGAEVAFVRMDRLDGLKGCFDFIVSNPPYISDHEYQELQKEVRDHEPRIALVPTQGPVPFYQTLVHSAVQHLNTDGLLILEIGYSMEVEIRNLFEIGWTLLPTQMDLQGIPRVVIARKTKVF